MCESMEVATITFETVFVEIRTDSDTYRVRRYLNVILSYERNIYIMHTLAYLLMLRDTS